MSDDGPDGNLTWVYGGIVPPRKWHAVGEGYAFCGRSFSDTDCMVTIPSARACKTCLAAYLRSNYTNYLDDEDAVRERRANE